MKTAHLLSIGLAALAAAGIATAIIVSDANAAEDKKGKTVALTKANFDEKTARGVTLVDFWAEWCGPCRMIAPTLEELAAEYEGKAVIAKVDVDSEGELAKRFKIEAIPNLKIIKDGKVVDEIVGLAPKAEIARKLDAQIGKSDS